MSSANGRFRLIYCIKLLLKCNAVESLQVVFDEGVFAMAIGYPTVPRGAARIRVMNTAAHSADDLEQALTVFEKVGRELAII